MSQLMGDDLILKINRPQYVPFSELFLSELAWRIADLPGWTGTVPVGDAKKVLGLMYDVTSGDTKNVTFKATRPSRTAESMRDWIHALDNNEFKFFSGDAGANADSVENAIRGVQNDKSSRSVATPLSPNIALLQNRQGGFGKKSPIDIGLIIEQIFALGDPKIETYTDGVDEVTKSATSLWYVAMRDRLHEDYELSRIDRSVADFILADEKNSGSGKTAKDIFPDRADLVQLMKPRNEMIKNNQVSKVFLGEQTPFHWMHKAWTALNSEKWVRALPARRWTDWATTILRVGFGFAYIWDANWNLAIASAITSSETEPNHVERCLYSTRSENQTKEKVTVEYILKSPRLLTGAAMRWKDSDNSLSIRDVAPLIRLTLSRGLQIRFILEEFLERQKVNKLTLEESLYELYSDADLRQRLNEAQRDKFKPNAKSLWEAVKYSLLTRSGTGEVADFYGLLSSRSRKFLIIDPATEWIAAISSLAIDQPDGIGDLGKVLTELARLGLRPSPKELTNCLELAGLAQSAADADTAVLVKSAF